MQSYDNISQAITVDYGNVQTLNHCSTVGCVYDGGAGGGIVISFCKNFSSVDDVHALLQGNDALALEGVDSILASVFLLFTSAMPVVCVSNWPVNDSWLFSISTV